MKRYARTVIGLVFLAAGTCFAAETENLAKDPSFEQVGVADKPLASWDFYTSKGKNIALTNAPVHSGEHALHLWTQGTKKSHLGVSQTFDVVPKGKYTFKAFVMNDKEGKLGGGVVGNLGIEWYDAEGAEISRASSKEWGPHLSKMHWEEFSVETKPPPYAVKMKCVIYLRDGDKDGSEGGCFIDDVEVSVKSK